MFNKIVKGFKFYIKHKEAIDNIIDTVVRVIQDIMKY